MNLKEGESSPIFNSFEKRLLIKGLRDQIDMMVDLLLKEQVLSEEG